MAAQRATVPKAGCGLSPLQFSTPIQGLHTAPDFPQDLLCTWHSTRCQECKSRELANPQDRRLPATCPDESHTGKGIFPVYPAKKEAAQPQGGQDKSRTLCLPSATFSMLDDPGRAPARSSQQRLPLNGQACLFQRLPLGHLAAPIVGSLG